MNNTIRNNTDEMKNFKKKSNKHSKNLSLKSDKNNQ